MWFVNVIRSGCFKVLVGFKVILNVFWGWLLDGFIGRVGRCVLHKGETKTGNSVGEREAVGGVGMVGIVESG